MSTAQFQGKFSPVNGLVPVRVLVPKTEISAMVKRLAKQITADYRGEQILLVAILKGSFLFLSDLVKEIDLEVEVDFMACSSYGNDTSSSGVVKILKDLDQDISNKHVILVEDIVDTGLTLNKIAELLSTRNPATLRICTAFDKPSRRKVDVEIPYKGIEIPDEFIVGYGLDYQGFYRNLEEVYILRENK